MTKLTMNPTKSSEPSIAPAQHVVVDAKGRKLTLKEPDILAPYRLVEMLGNSSENRVYMQMVFPFIYLVAIDDDTHIHLNNKRELEALIKRLDHEGVKALREGVESEFGVKPDGEQTQDATIKK